MAMWLQEMATADNRPKDVDREYVTMFSVTNEASSFMLRANLQKFFPGMPEPQYESMADAVPAFAANENMHAINGMPMPTTIPSQQSHLVGFVPWREHYGLLALFTLQSGSVLAKSMAESSFMLALL